MGGSGDGGVGPVGSSTNAPSIDTGTTARIRNTAPSDKMKPQAGKSQPDTFDVSRLLPVLHAQKWFVGEDFMRSWINWPACKALGDPKTKDNKATISANLKNKCMKTKVIDWTWLLQKDFTEAKDGLKTFTETKIFNDAAVKEIIKTYGVPRANLPVPNGKFGQFLQDGVGPEVFFPEIEEHQLQHMSVTVDQDPATANDLMAALANFGYYAMYRGETIRDRDFQKRLNDFKSMVIPLNLVPLGVPADKFDTELVTQMKLRFQAVILIDAVGVYAGDIYEFGGDQYLGQWDLKKLTVSKASMTSGAAFKLGFSNNPGPEDKVIRVENILFQRFRDRNQHGGDFFVFTPIKLIPQNPPRFFTVPR
jgi:hypothetical protein